MSCQIAEGEPGKYPEERLPSGWVYADVSFMRKSTGQIEKRIEIIDLRKETLKSGALRYLQEPMQVIAVKCAGLFVLLTPYFFAYAAFQLIRLPVATLIQLSPSVFCRQIWKIVQIPFYFVALEFSALYGIFKPLEGRAWFGFWESCLHDGKNRSAAIRYEKTFHSFSDLLWLGWKELSSERTLESLFLAFCMQPIGKSTDPHLHDEYGNLEIL